MTTTTQQHKVASGSAFVAQLIVTLALLLCSVWIYWPGISGPELLDDRSSVLVIGDVRAHPELAMDYIFGDNSGIFGRSVSMATFVLEKMYFDEGIGGNKKVNIILHALNGGLVIWLLSLLFRLKAVPAAGWLAIVLGGIWLLHPLLVSTVLYAVQRMAMLVTFFILTASVCYVYWRQSVMAGKGGVLRFLPVPLLLFIGLLAKENAIVLVPVLLLLEALWFRFVGADGKPILWLQRLCYTLIAGAIGVAAGVLFFDYDGLAARFGRRPFSLDERLLTQARVLWDYVAQFFIPQLDRMGLYHDDVIVSQSLWEPGTTVYAVGAWVLVALVCGLALRWQTGRWLVVGVAWFLAGHSVESSVLPLEIYFEHRNYFPAIGLVFLIGAAYSAFVKRWPEPAVPLLVCMAIWGVYLSGQTSSQVQIWSNRSVLILNHLNGHPESSRANNDMAVQLARHGEIEAALRYSHRSFLASANKAATNERHADYLIRNMALHCIANTPSAPELTDELGEEEAGRPLSSVTTLLTLVRLLQENGCPQFDRIRFADQMADIYLNKEVKRSASMQIYSSLAVLENALERYDNAYAYVDKVTAASPGDKRAMLMKLHFATALGRKDVVTEIVATMQALDGRGKLTVAEKQNLALYLEK
ncbi:MAG: hypothetical protein ACI9JM_002767 [Halioglobus sp.]|jgi:hypothetical protein